MKKLATALVAAGALFALSGCVADPYYGNSYYGGGGISTADRVMAITWE